VAKSNNEGMKVLFIVPYPTEGPSSRYRVEQYLPHLRAAGIEATVRSFIRPASFYQLLYRRGHIWRKALFFLFSAASRLLDVVRASRYDLVFIHREAFPFGPPLVEWLLARLGCPLVYDFDDAIYLPNSSQANRWLGFLKTPGKTARIISYSRRVIAGNDYLRDYARQYNPQVTIIPTPVDTDLYTVRPYPGAGGSEVTIGWMGSTTTSHYLRLLDDVFRRLAGRYNLTVKVVGGDYRLEGVNILNRPWSLAGEVADLQSFDIGVMPLPDNEWTRGKCGFKLLQYMGVGVPVVCSPVGVNGEIVQDGVNGYLAATEEEWLTKLSDLIEDASRRQELGRQGRATVEARYSVKVNAPRLLEVLHAAVEG
jgi:glycosyltransferase involved in cell wall biosynthesis